MRNRLILLIMLVTGLSACAPFGASNRLKKSLTPEAASGEGSSSATPQTVTEADIIAPTPSGKNLQPQLAQADIPLDEVTTLLPPDAIPAILPAEAGEIMVTASYANDNDIEPEVRVIGVSINGENRAYPIPFLSRHEIVNTEIGGQPVAVTW